MGLSFSRQRHPHLLRCSESPHPCLPESSFLLPPNGPISWHLDPQRASPSCPREWCLWKESVWRACRGRWRSLGARKGRDSGFPKGSPGGKPPASISSPFGELLPGGPTSSRCAAEKREGPLGRHLADFSSFTLFIFLCVCGKIYTHKI